MRQEDCRIQIWLSGKQGETDDPEKRGIKSTDYKINKGQKTILVTMRELERSNSKRMYSETEISELSLHYKVISIQECLHVYG